MEIDIIEDAVLKSINKIVSKNKNCKSITLYTNLTEVGINDIDLIKIILEIEKNLAIELNDNDFDFRELNTVTKIIKYIYKFTN